MLKRRPVHQPRVDVTHISPNRSSRLTWPPTLIVLHDTEAHDTKGLSDLQGVGNWFANPASQVSAHIVVDGEGHTIRCVDDRDKAWHCMAYNSASLGIEQIGYATFTRALWDRNARAQLKKVAKWIAHWSNLYGIPIQSARVSNGVVQTPGIATHAELGQAGGGHHDPGPNYPLSAVLRMAKYYKKYGWR